MLVVVAADRTALAFICAVNAKYDGDLQYHLDAVDLIPTMGDSICAAIEKSNGNQDFLLDAKEQELMMAVSINVAMVM